MRKEKEPYSTKPVAAVNASRRQAPPILDVIREPAKTYETRTPAERAEAFLAWVDSHKGDTGSALSEEAISREAIYAD